MGNTNSSENFQKLKNQNINEINPLEIFNLRKKFTWDELKNSYKKLALKYHPDKPGGDKETFDYITTCFKKLSKQLSEKNSNKSHEDLKNLNKTDNFEELRPNFAKLSSDNNFSEKFNEVFIQNKFKDEDEEFGYGDQMEKSSKIRDDLDIENILGNKKLSNHKFNLLFDQKIPEKKELIIYAEPQALYSSKNIQYTELGTKTEDYSGNGNSLNYTDYMKAYSPDRVSTQNNRKEFKSLKDYSRYSDNLVKQSFTEKEQLKFEEQKNIHSKIERQRQLKVENKDSKIKNYYEKVSKLFIQ